MTPSLEAVRTATVTALKQTGLDDSYIDNIVGRIEFTGDVATDIPRIEAVLAHVVEELKAANAKRSAEFERWYATQVAQMDASTRFWTAFHQLRTTDTIH